jgi:hypothetical protein
MHNRGKKRASGLRNNYSQPRCVTILESPLNTFTVPGTVALDTMLSDGMFFFWPSGSGSIIISTDPGPTINQQKN